MKKHIHKNQARICLYCGELWIYDRVNKPTQKYTCGKKECRYKQKQEYTKEWRKKHPGYNNNRMKEYYKKHPDRVKDAQKKWREGIGREKWLETIKRNRKKWLKTENGKKKHNESVRKYRKTENGRKYEERHRHRRYGYLEVLPNIFEDCLIDRHHIDKKNPSIVIALPRTIHRKASGRKEEHYTKNKEFIEKTYMIDTNLFFGRFNDAGL